MRITSRQYTGAADLAKIQAATARWTAITGFGHYLHVGDIVLRLYKGMRRYDPREIIHLWEDANRQVVGWGFVYPRWDSYEVAVHPDYRSKPVFTEIVEWAEQETWRWMDKEGRGDGKINLEIFDNDPQYIALLEERGYVCGEHERFISQRSLDDPIPDLELPPGFTVRPVEGAHEADKMVEAQTASFGWTLAVDDYRRVMQSPIYGIERELVVVAPDGRFAAFCTLLLDGMNKLGMFEDVTTHSDFRRLGLGRAMLYAGMDRLKARGMTTALVPHRSVEENEAAFKLYMQVGFRPTYIFHGYEKDTP